MKVNMKLIMENWRKHKKLLTEESVWDAWYTKDDWDEFEVDDEGVETYPEPPDHLPALYQARTKERAEAIIKAILENPDEELEELSGKPKDDLLDMAEELGHALAKAAKSSSLPGASQRLRFGDFHRGTPSEEIDDAAEEAVKMIIAVRTLPTPEIVLKQFSPEQVKALENSYRSQFKDPKDPRIEWSLEDAVTHTVENTGATAGELFRSLKNQLSKGL